MQSVVTKSAEAVGKIRETMKKSNNLMEKHDGFHN